MTEIESDSSDSEYNPIKTSNHHQTTKPTNKPIEKSSNPKSKKSSRAYASKDGQGYAWEDEYKRSWDILREDDSGSLESAVNQLKANQRKRIIRDTTSIQRGIIRHLCLIIDLSIAMTDRDLRPNRLEISLNYAQDFITEFFDQNPISQMCILITKDAIAERLSPYQVSNPVDHHKALSNKRKLEPSGEPSLQNALEMARATLAHLPPHGSKETLVIMGSLTTCDPEDIHQTIERLENDRMRVSIVGLSAEIQICKEICRRTKGKYGVIMNETHFKDLLFESIPPPPSLSTSTSTQSSIRSNPTSSDLIQMGFPTKLSNPIPSLCACHSKLHSSGFICPRCGSKLCDVPTDCLICGLTVVSSPHLARSYRHLFPVANWKELHGSSKELQETSSSKSCYGCSQPFSNSNSNEFKPNQIGLKYLCNRCKRIFCSVCDQFYEQLGLCPGCCV
ncbi:Ssl1-like-domain-containing protein [Melampsora americana]|nr:Ssl1-like-domain-containing protein [Melampsora americana]